MIRAWRRLRLTLWRWRLGRRQRVLDAFTRHPYDPPSDTETVHRLNLHNAVNVAKNRVYLLEGLIGAGRPALPLPPATTKQPMRPIRLTVAALVGVVSVLLMAISSGEIRAARRVETIIEPAVAMVVTAHLVEGSR